MLPARNIFCMRNNNSSKKLVQVNVTIFSGDFLTCNNAGEFQKSRWWRSTDKKRQQGVGWWGKLSGNGCDGLGRGSGGFAARQGIWTRILRTSNIYDDSADDSAYDLD